jgi:hypothetical protein
MEASPCWQDGFTDCLYCEGGYVDVKPTVKLTVVPPSEADTLRAELAKVTGERDRYKAILKDLGYF